VPADREAALVALLERAQHRGLLGPGPVEAHLEHAGAWAEVLGPPPARVLDLGTGAGIPGLALAIRWPDARLTLLDARERRGEWLEAAVAELELEGRVDVVVGRAESLARGGLREQFGLVVARGFGSPAATAECAAGFVAVGGRLSVSEPPEGGSDRWPADVLADLGFAPPHFVRDHAGFVILPKDAPTADRWPRRDGVPQHRPLW
jgi:16S rRNA (guanine527-N7)-methyltransferase